MENPEAPVSTLTPDTLVIREKIAKDPLFEAFGKDKEGTT
jgi:hypothetical protein